MAQRKQDLFGNVIGRITELPGAKGVIESVQGLGDRLDDMQKRVRGLEQMEKRLADLEKRVKALEGGGPATRARSTAKKTTSTKTSASSSKSARAAGRAEERRLAGHAKPQRPRHDLEARGRRPGLLAVELDRDGDLGRRRTPWRCASRSIFGCERCVPR